MNKLPLDQVDIWRPHFWWSCKCLKNPSHFFGRVQISQKFIFFSKNDLWEHDQDVGYHTHSFQVSRGLHSLWNIFLKKVLFRKYGQKCGRQISTWSRTSIYRSEATCQAWVTWWILLSFGSSTRSQPTSKDLQVLYIPQIWPTSPGWGISWQYRKPRVPR